MTIQDQLKQQMKGAMKSGDTELRDNARVLLSEFVRVDKEVDDDQAREILKSLSKHEKENLKRTGEEKGPYLELICSFLPEEISPEVIKRWIEENVDFSKLGNKMAAIGIASKHFGSDADGNVIKEVVLGM